METKGIVDSTALIVAVVGLVSSVLLQQCNHKAELALEEKRFESSLITQAIDEDNKAVTMNRLKLLLKAGVLSPEKAAILKNLSDSVFVVDKSSFYTGSDTVSFYDFQITNGLTDVPLFFQYVRGAHILIEPTDTIQSPPFRLMGYTDNLGRAEIAFPRKFVGAFVRVAIEKAGYRAKVIEAQLPGDINTEEIVLKKQ